MLGFGLSVPFASVHAGGFSPLALFAANEPGAWYDPSDLTTLFQDSAGTTPVTAVEQPVGLLLDKSRGLVLGANIVLNGDFGNGAANWTQGGTLFTIGSGVATASAAVYNTDYIEQTLSLTAGMTYRLTLTVTAYTAGSLRVDIVGVQTVITGGVTAAGTYTYHFVAGLGGSRQLRITGSTPTAFTGSIDNISVRELPGNHASQSTTTARPVLSALVNLLQRTEEFDNAYWTKNSLGITPNADGVADLIVPTTASAGHNFQRIVAVTPSTTYRLSIKAKKSGYRYFYFGQVNGPTAASIFDFDTATYGASLGSGTTYSATLQADGYWLLSMTFTTGAAVTSVTVEGSSQAVAGFTAFAGDGVSGALIKDADLRVANESAQLPAYQRVTTATDYDTAGFPVYLRFDGTDDSLSTGSINFTSTAQMSVFAGVRKLSDAAVAMLAELSVTADTSPGSFYLLASAADPNFRWSVRGSAVNQRNYSYAAPTTKVLSAALTTAAATSTDAIAARFDGSAQSGSNNISNASTGNFDTYPLFIGRRNNASLPYNGRMYGIIVRGAATTAADIAATERWLAAKSGVVLP